MKNLPTVSVRPGAVAHLECSARLNGRRVFEARTIVPVTPTMTCPYPGNWEKGTVVEGNRTDPTLRDFVLIYSGAYTAYILREDILP